MHVLMNLHAKDINIRRPINVGGLRTLQLLMRLQVMKLLIQIHTSVTSEKNIRLLLLLLMEQMQASALIEK